MAPRQRPAREQVFIFSLMLHGFRLTLKRKKLKKGKRYIVPATAREDAGGIDMWVKMRGETSLIPVQITQRGVRLFRTHKPHSPIDEFIRAAETRVRRKRRLCRRHRIAFVLVRDFAGTMTNRTLAWGDIKALHYAVAHYHRNREKSRR